MAAVLTDTGASMAPWAFPQKTKLCQQTYSLNVKGETVVLEAVNYVTLTEDNMHTDSFVNLTFEEQFDTRQDEQTRRTGRRCDACCFVCGLFGMFTETECRISGN